jgi:hypothetical protein
MDGVPNLPLHSESVEGLTDIESEAGLVPPDLPENTPPQPGEMLQTECAFVVYKTAEGIWAADSTLLGKPIAIGREANLHDMRHAAHDIIHGILIQETAQTTVVMQQQAAQQMMAKAAQAQEFARLQAATVGAPTQGGVDLGHLKK